MKVAELMNRDIATCTPNTDLAQAAWQMWERDCGVIPVVEDGRLVGMITDRDIAIAAATKSRSAHEILVGEVIQEELHVCIPEDDAKTALGIMARGKVRRLPVVDEEDRLQGIVSLNDLIIHAESGRGSGRNGSWPSGDEILATLKEISAHRREERSLEPAQRSAERS